MIRVVLVKQVQNIHIIIYIQIKSYPDVLLLLFAPPHTLLLLLSLNYPGFLVLFTSSPIAVGAWFFEQAIIVPNRKFYHLSHMRYYYFLIRLCNPLETSAQSAVQGQGHRDTNDQWKRGCCLLSQCFFFFLYFYYFSSSSNLHRAVNAPHQYIFSFSVRRNDSSSK